MNELNIFFDTAVDMQAIATDKGRFKRINRSWQNVLGWSEDEVLSRTLFSLIHPDDVAAMEELLVNKDPQKVLGLRFLHKDGPYLDFSVRTRFASTGDVLLVAQEVTATQDLKIYLNEMERVAQIGYWSWEINSAKLTWSSEVYRIHEIPIGTPISREKALTYFVPEHRSIVEKLVNECIENGIPYDLELSIVSATGVQKWVHLIGQPRFHKEKIIGIFGVFQDVTNYRHRIFDYIESQNRLKIALSANNMGVWDWNVKDDVLIWDDSMFNLFEIKKEDFTGNYAGIDRVIHPDDKKRIRDAVELAVETAGEFSTWFRIILPSGALKYIAAKGRLTGGEDNSVWLTGVNWDITLEKVQEITIHTQQAQMVTSARLSSLGEMAGGIAHEVNNPLQVILGRANQLKRKINSGHFDVPDIVDGLSSIETTCDRIVKIIKGLRAFSRNAENDPFVWVDVNEVIQDVTVLISQKFKHHSIALDCDLKCDKKIMGRPVQLGQVFMNLLNNAFDAVSTLPEKWIKITTECDKDELIIRVYDAGNGIPQTVQEKIFEPFYTTKEVGKGTGLGLPISKGIVEDHGGNFFIDSSSPNTCFVMKLPLAE